MKSVWRKVRPYVYILPALLPLLVFVYYPLYRSLQISFLQWNMVSPNPKWVGLSNYTNLLTSDEFWIAVKNTGFYALILLIGLFAAPFLVAFAVTRANSKWASFYKGAIFTPTVLSLSVSSIVFLWLLNPVIGVINHTLAAVGISGVNWLSDPFWAKWAVSLSVTWKEFGYNFIVLLAGLLAIPQEMSESARVQGLRSNFGLLRKIIIPMASGTLIYVFVTAIVVGIQDVFVPVEMLTNGGPNQSTSNLVFLVYQYGFQFFKSGLASATAIITFIAFLLLIIVQALVMDRRAYYEN
ncbi:sugar ABC transporter permease [Paenibacillus filicis]|uniref:Sugar ABC transporter permease n=1 Tax=Paenibacillus gyeongsangnamensis TaxID=3388067 RepID=A0ABT4Q1Z2_9BACL|nr:sugar ABC transporter permease [Paenibacillus filicis]MCZ8510900.1 sugar ABC transporter permease [Paenibacillus filicis]